MSVNAWGDGQTEFFYQLTPDEVLDSIEMLGFQTTGRVLPLNSMENRVYEIEITPQKESNNPSDSFKVAKFYRPGRWSQEQILEEHLFLKDLVAAEIPVMAPLSFEGETLFKAKNADLFFCVYDKKGGRNLDEPNEDQIRWLGRLMGRMHAIGKMKKTSHRLSLDLKTYGESNLNFILENDLLPENIKESYETLCKSIFELSRPYFEGIEYQRIHGDCHWGNIIWDEKHGPFFVDFDDMLYGPVVQDLWQVLPGKDEITKRHQDIFLESYSYWHEFPHRSLKLIEPLRALRFIHFSAWIGKRWEDPSFQTAFPYYGSEQYWYGQINDLREQQSEISQLGQFII